MSRKFRVKGKNNSKYIRGRTYQSGPIYDADVEQVDVDRYPNLEYVDYVPKPKKVEPIVEVPKPKPKPKPRKRRSRKKKLKYDLDGDGDVDKDDRKIAAELLGSNAGKGE